MNEYYIGLQNYEKYHKSTIILRIIKKKPSHHCWRKGFSVRKVAASYSPALHCSTIGAGGLNFSVRNGKRWDPAAITTWLKVIDNIHKQNWSMSILTTPDNMNVNYSAVHCRAAKAFGQLVVLGFDVTVFTPAPYQRPRLGRPSMESSSCGWLRT